MIKMKRMVRTAFERRLCGIPNVNDGHCVPLEMALALGWS